MHKLFSGFHSVKWAFTAYVTHQMTHHSFKCIFELPEMDKDFVSFFMKVHILLCVLGFSWVLWYWWNAIE